MDMADRAARSDVRRPSLRVLIADEQTLFRAALGYLLCLPDRVTEITGVGTFDQAITVLRCNPYDLVLTEMMLPGMGREHGIAVLKRVARGAVLAVVSSDESPVTIRKALAAGAVGFIPKRASPETLIRAVEAILAGGAYVPPDAFNRPAAASADRLPADRLAAGRLAAGRLAAEGTPPEGSGMERLPPDDRSPQRVLTPSQLAVLRQMALGRSNKVIAHALDLSEATVKVHVGAILRSLNVTNRTQAVLAAVRFGLTATGQEPGREQGTEGFSLPVS